MTLTSFLLAATLCPLVSATTLNVWDFGAKGDGVTDDTAAIQRGMRQP